MIHPETDKEIDDQREDDEMTKNQTESKEPSRQCKQRKAPALFLGEQCWFNKLPALIKDDGQTCDDRRQQRDLDRREQGFRRSVEHQLVGEWTVQPCDHLAGKGKGHQQGHQNRGPDDDQTLLDSLDMCGKGIEDLCHNSGPACWLTRLLRHRPSLWSSLQLVVSANTDQFCHLVFLRQLLFVQSFHGQFFGGG